MVTKEEILKYLDDNYDVKKRIRVSVTVKPTQWDIVNLNNGIIISNPTTYIKKRVMETFTIPNDNAENIFELWFIKMVNKLEDMENEILTFLDDNYAYRRCNGPSSGVYAHTEGNWFEIYRMDGYEILDGVSSVREEIMEKFSIPNNDAYHIFDTWKNQTIEAMKNNKTEEPIAKEEISKYLDENVGIHAVVTSQKLKSYNPNTLGKFYSLHKVFDDKECSANELAKELEQILPFENQTIYTNILEWTNKQIQKKEKPMKNNKKSDVMSKLIDLDKQINRHYIHMPATIEADTLRLNLTTLNVGGKENLKEIEKFINDKATKANREKYDAMLEEKLILEDELRKLLAK